MLPSVGCKGVRNTRSLYLPRDHTSSIALIDVRISSSLPSARHVSIE